MRTFEQTERFKDFPVNRVHMFVDPGKLAERVHVGEYLIR